MAYPDEVLADGPTVYWRLGDAEGSTTAADLSGNGFNGTYRNDPLVGVVVGFVHDDPDFLVGFDGTQNDSVVGDTIVGPATLEAFTLECIAVVNGATPTGQLLTFADPVGFSSDLIELWWDTTTGRINFDFQGTSAYSPSATALVGGVHHWAATFDGSELVLYRDGIAVDTQAFVDDGALLIAPCALAVCDYPLEAGGPLTANVDEVAFYWTALSPARVAAHYAAMIAGDDPDPDPDPTGVECVQVFVPDFIADGATADANGIVYTPTLVGGWWDSIPLRSATAEVQPRGEFVTVAQELGREVELVIVAHAPGGQAALGPALCFTAMETIKAAFRVVFVPVAFRVVDPYADRTAQARRVGPIKQTILGKSVAVRSTIPLLAPDPRRFPTP